MAAGTLHHPHRRVARQQGAWLSALIPLALVLAGNGLIFATGSQGSDPAFDALDLAPPGWAVALIWVLIYPMWGLARWYAARNGRRGKRVSWWVIALMGWGLVYPLLTGFKTMPSAWANLASLLLASLTLWRVSTVSRKGAALLIPSVGWIAFATVLGFVALTKV
jgi:tryptophan-rich sensory protein